MARIEDILEINKAVYDSYENMPGFSLVNEFSDPESGFFGRMLRSDNTGEIVVSFRGTDKLNDWDDNIQIGLGVPPDQGAQATQYLAQVINKNPGIPIHVTGHSLGGNLAAHAMKEVFKDPNEPV